MEASLMKPIKIVLNDHGYLLAPSLHDAEIIKVELTGDCGVSLLFVTKEKVRYEIALHKVERFRANDFLEGNIVSEVTIQTGEKADPHIVTKYLFDLFDIDKIVSDVGRAATVNQIQTLVDRIRAGDFKLIYIEPSYGCEIVGVCQSISTRVRRPRRASIREAH
jgi:hypothetical protein